MLAREDDESDPVPPQLIEFFNKRYEFYGRKLVLRPFTPSGCGDAGTPKPAADVAPDRSAIGSNPERRFASASSRNLARKP